MNLFYLTQVMQEYGWWYNRSGMYRLNYFCLNFEKYHTNLLPLDLLVREGRIITQQQILDNIIIDDEAIAEIEADQKAYKDLRGEYELSQSTSMSAHPSIESQPTLNSIGEVDYKSLMGFVSGSITDITHVMKHKAPREGVKLRWTSYKGDALLLLDILEWSMLDINNCFSFKGNKPLSLGNRKKRGESEHLRNVLQKIKG